MKRLYRISPNLKQILWTGVLLSFCTVSLAAQDGSLDPTFGTGGLVNTDFGDGDRANALAIQSDGKIVAAGQDGSGAGGSNFGLARYNSDGSLDVSFGSSGLVSTDFGGFGMARALKIQSDGKIVAAGRDGVGVVGSDFALARYNNDGTLDLSFDTDGLVTTDFGTQEDANALAIQTDGKIVAAGFSGSDFAIARYNSDGSLDATFGSGGLVTTDFGGPDEANALAIQSDGKILAAGIGRQVGAGTEDFGLARYNNDGTLDATFGSSGLVSTDFGGYEEAYALAIQSDGKILAAGQVVIGTDFGGYALARYNSDGSLDATFGTGGLVSTDFGSNHKACALAIQSDGKIVVAGSDNAGGDFALARYNSDGTLDLSFDTDGLVSTDLGGFDEANALAIQSDGKIVAAGRDGAGADFSDFGLARYIGTPPLCGITDLAAGNQSACDPNSNTYTQEVTVTYENDPGGDLIVNGQNFVVTSSPQTVTLVDLGSDGQQVNVTASFSVTPECSLSVNSLFTAPFACNAIDICAEIDLLIADVDGLINDNSTPNKALSKLEKARKDLVDACEEFNEGEYDRGFKELADALKDLDKAIDKGSAAGEIIDATVDLARLIATTTIDEAGGLDSDPAVDRLLDKAAEALADGDSYRNDGKAEKAVGDYGKAWEYAAEAILLAGNIDTGTGVTVDLDPILDAINTFPTVSLDKKGRKALDKARSKVADAQEKFDDGKIEEGFGKLEDAVGYLEDALDSDAEVGDIISEVLDIGNSLAIDHIDAATEYTGIYDVDALISKAINYRFEGDDYRNEGKFEKAMARYRKAWSKAQEAIETGNGLTKTAAHQPNEVPLAFALEQNYPNPFNPTTAISYQLPEAGNVRLVVYNSLGQKVKTLVSANQSTGRYTVQWDGSNDHGQRVASGLYIYRIQAGANVQVRKMIMMK